MKKKLMVFAVAAVFLVTLAGVAMAGQGQGNGAGDGTGPIHDIFAGTPFAYSGAVVEFIAGDGMVIATDGGDVVIYGIGPARYWDSLEVARPAVGEDVSVEGYAVDYNGEIRNIAVTITVGGQTIPLRDPATGLPLWRQGALRQQ